jgi:hypothetical protein
MDFEQPTNLQFFINNFYFKVEKVLNIERIETSDKGRKKICKICGALIEYSSVIRCDLCCGRDGGVWGNFICDLCHPHISYYGQYKTRALKIIRKYKSGEVKCENVKCENVK